MSQTPSPEYVPPPRGSSTGLIVGIVVAVFLLLVAVCGVGLLGVGFLAFRTVETRIQPVPQMDLAQPIDPPVIEPPPVEVPQEAPAVTPTP